MYDLWLQHQRVNIPAHARTGRGSLLSHPLCPPDDPVSQGTELNCTDLLAFYITIVGIGPVAFCYIWPLHVNITNIRPVQLFHIQSLDVTITGIGPVSLCHVHLLHVTVVGTRPVPWCHVWPLHGPQTAGPSVAEHDVQRQLSLRPLSALCQWVHGPGLQVWQQVHKVVSICCFWSVSFKYTSYIHMNTHTHLYVCYFVHK